MDPALAEAVVNHLREHGLSLRGGWEPDGLAPGVPGRLVSLQGHSASISVRPVYVPRGGISLVSPADLRAHRNSLFLLAPYVNPRSAAMLRELGVPFLDAAGNAFITFEGVYIDIQGRKSLPDKTMPGRRTSPRVTSTAPLTLFTPKRSQVIFALLTWPELAQASIRSLAHHSGTSVGLAQSTVNALKEAELFPRPEGTPSQSPLRELWLASYPSGLGKTLALGSFRGAVHGGGWDPARTHIGGESAVPTLLSDPETLTLYTDEEPRALARQGRWTARPGEEPNIFIRRKFWRDPENKGQGGDSPANTVPPLLIEADLIASQDPRQLEAARLLKNSA